ncbi:hypothetical protein CTheo_3660 [Ceratobasidium theobromae]|uniref:BAG domain-containing protein n=1 Tax=Ceratobasidium theobromae TaxID=1582974 RepID=A0A5N5QMX3_9AGAM|nr:hypothetical protein CTheo_3660 [Ceratobasidium theobromae]
MFTLSQPVFQTCYSPYGDMFLQQELHRRRQIEAYRRREREIEELERRRQYERMLLQAELERQQVALQRRRRRQAAHHAMFNPSLQSLFNALYGGESGARPRSEPKHDGSFVPVSTQTPSGPVPEPKLELEPKSVDTAPSHAEIQSILTSFAALQSGFVLPTYLDFDPTSTPTSPKLAYTPANASLRGYEHALTGILTQLDAVESFGDVEVRRVRKEAVKTVEKELERLDAIKMGAWNEHFGASQAESAPETETAQIEVDPVGVPLPQDSDSEEENEEASPAEELRLEILPGSISAVSVELAPASGAKLIQEPLPSSEAFRSPLIAELPSLPKVDTPTLTGELPSQSLGSPSPSETSSSDSDLRLEDYIEVEIMSASEDAEIGQVVNGGDLELMHEWDLDF